MNRSKNQSFNEGMFSVFALNPSSGLSSGESNIKRKYQSLLAATKNDYWSAVGFYIVLAAAKHSGIKPEKLISSLKNERQLQK